MCSLVLFIFAAMDSEPIVSFDNTEIAFKGKSNGDLKKAYYLFKLIGNPGLVRFGDTMVGLALSLRIPIGWAIKGNIFKQFCGGENIEECARATKILDKGNIGTILDYSVEGKESEQDFERTCEETLQTIRTANNNSHIPFCVFKVTGIARFDLLEKVNANQDLSEDEKDEWKRVEHRVDRICALAHETGTPIFIDAEDSWIQDAIDALADSMMAKYNKQSFIVYNTIQLYRHDRLEFLKKSHRQGIEGGYKCGFKLVRGAYMEKERERALQKGYLDPIQPNKEASDRDFDLAVEYCIENINDIAICCGSHNELSSLKLAELMVKKNISRNDKRVYFAQLFGMSDHLSFNLAHAGFNVAKYVPYGPIKEVIPYLIRRAKENTSVKGQTGRELGLIIKELRRRKLA
jgi:proline dehydrogenase